jgi:hypothetical protein
VQSPPWKSGSVEVRELATGLVRSWWRGGLAGRAHEPNVGLGDEGAKEVCGRKTHSRIWATRPRVESRNAVVGGSQWTMNGSMS